MPDDDLLVDLRTARGLLDGAMDRIEAGNDGNEETDRVSPFTECGTEFESLTAKLDHDRDEHGIDV